MGDNALKNNLKNSSCIILYILFACFIGFTVIENAYGAKVVDRIIAVVNDDIITLYELNQKLTPYANRIKALEYSGEQERKMLFKVRENVLNQLIDQKIEDQEIRRFKIAISEEDVDKTIERMKKANFYTDEDIRSALARDGLTMEMYRKEIKEQILRSRLINIQVKSKIVITEEDIKAYYKSHQDMYSGKKKYHLHNIIMLVPSNADVDKKLKIKEKLEAVMDKLKSGQPFEKMAQIYSESPQASDGGDLGLFTLDQLSPVLRQVIEKTAPGKFTPVIDTDQGYQIFFVQKIVKTPGRSLKEVSSDIEKKLYDEIVNEKFKGWIEDLRKKSVIKIIQ